MKQLIDIVEYMRRTGHTRSALYTKVHRFRRKHGTNPSWYIKTADGMRVDWDAYIAAEDTVIALYEEGQELYYKLAYLLNGGPHRIAARVFKDCDRSVANWTNFMEVSLFAPRAYIPDKPHTKIREFIRVASEYIKKAEHGKEQNDT